MALCERMCCLCAWVCVSVWMEVRSQQQPPSLVACSAYCLRQSLPEPGAQWFSQKNPSRIPSLVPSFQSWDNRWSPEHLASYMGAQELSSVRPWVPVWERHCSRLHLAFECLWRSSASSSIYSTSCNFPSISRSFLWFQGLQELQLVIFSLRSYYCLWWPCIPVALLDVWIISSQYSSLALSSNWRSHYEC